MTMDEQSYILVQDWQVLIAILVVFGVGFLVGKFDFKAKEI
jgi:hypothetical protein